MSVREKLNASLKDRFAYQTAEYAEPLTIYRLKEALEMMADEIDANPSNLIVEGEIKKLSLQPGDIVVIHVKQNVTAEQADHLATQMNDIIRREGHRNEIAVLTSQLQLSIVTPDE